MPLPDEVKKQVADFTEEDLTHIANKLGDDYMNQMFWDSLKIITEEYLEVKNGDMGNN